MYTFVLIFRDMFLVRVRADTYFEAVERWKKMPSYGFAGMTENDITDHYIE